jgi:hypothetical protein
MEALFLFSGLAIAGITLFIAFIVIFWHQQSKI